MEWLGCSLITLRGSKKFVLIDTLQRRRCSSLQHKTMNDIVHL